MRTRAEIEENIPKGNSEVNTIKNLELIIELLLDIRELKDGDKKG